MAGHLSTCPLFKENEKSGTSSRSKLYNSTSVLWCKSQRINFFTFTLPSLHNSPTCGVYQRSPTCKETGDLAITAKFSKLLEAISIRQKRSGQRFSYVWVSEAQMKRQKKFGGIGDLHFHLVTDAYIEIAWLQNAWGGHVGESNNSVDVQSIPKSVQSIPAYLVKYLGKGSQRYIYSRKFNCSRDLSAFVPIHIARLPDVDLITEKIITQPSGYESCMRYYNTAECLELFGCYMLDQKRFNVTRTSKKLTDRLIRLEKERGYALMLDQKEKFLQTLAEKSLLFDR